LKIGNSNEIVIPGAMYDVIFNAHYYIANGNGIYDDTPSHQIIKCIFPQL